ncbi:phosphotransferase family protein [Actinokineospora enzanensis]|uniref:phosphotransferase family protein n=1 Tax=Actinokineospora enzanensis TaxID=155975 RepID=UPI000477A083|nr:phosphotransferase [Actinokineospora enzanensis]
MTTRREWGELPEQVRGAVESRTGPVVKAESASSGRNSEFAATLWTSQAVVFCKGITTASSLSVMHHNEISISPFLPRELAPRLLWHVEEEGWLLLGFEHVTGRHADLSPGSSDIPLVTDAVNVIARTPVSTNRRAMAVQWARVLKAEIHADPPDQASPWSVENVGELTAWAGRAPEHMDGSALIHTDLNPANFLISDTAQVVDWAWWRTGAAWIDPAFVLIRLIAAGHSPAQAEQWANRISGFRDADSDALTAFAASVLRLWERRFAATEATAAARVWARYRLGES